MPEARRQTPVARTAAAAIPHQLGGTGNTVARELPVTMGDVYYEERADRAVLQSDAEGEWLSSDAVVELDTWA